jgi:FkbH-like protein
MQLDYFELIRKHRGLDTSTLGESLRLAILGDAATQQLVVPLKVLFAERGIRLETYEGPFDATELSVYDPSSELYKFAPEMILILTSVQALKTRYYKRAGSGAEFFQAEASRLTTIWEAIRKHTAVPVIQSNFALPVERIFGNFDQKVGDSLYAVVGALNLSIAEQARSRNQVFINDVEAIASYVGRETWFENRLWNMYKVFCALVHLPRVAKNILDVALSIRGRAVKCVVLDLDNTLWGGVIGDDGVHGIALSAHGDGEAFYDLQSFVLELQKRGILLAVCSKNNPENALKPFLEHPEMVLKRDHITVFTANWENKADNIRKIRETLNIGFDSMVFLDDNPFERNLVRSLLPGVIVPELPEEPADYVRAICELNLFETSSFSAADAQRTELYRQRAERAEAETQFSSVEDYLKSLDTVITVGRFDPPRLPRIAQLFQRSNQFNLTTQRRTEAECEALMNDADAHPIYAALRDRLGDHGLIGIVIAQSRAEDLFVSDWLMSCRVLTRGVEQFLMNHCVEHAQRLGKTSIAAEFRPTAKNAMVKDFYAQFGFQKIAEADDGRSSWRLEVASYQPKTVFMRVSDAALSASDAG